MSDSFIGKVFVFEDEVYVVVSEPFESDVIGTTVVALWADGTFLDIPCRYVGSSPDREI